MIDDDWTGNVSGVCSSSNFWISTSPLLLVMTKVNATDAQLDWKDVGLPEYVVYRSSSPRGASELERVPTSYATDPVLQDGVKIWYHDIQQRGL